MKFTLLAMGAIAALADPAPCPMGQFATGTMVYNDTGYEPNSNVHTRNQIVHFPTNGTSSDSFPLIAYAHGAAGGGLDIDAYNQHFAQLASFGYVVIAPSSCFMGCLTPVIGWESFSFENTRSIEFAKNTTDSWGKLIDWEIGMGLAGHSMGAASLVMNSQADVVKKYNIKAIVIEHGYAVGTRPEMKTNVVPTLVMTSTTDVEVPPYDSKPIYVNDPTFPKAWRNQKGLGHLEPLAPNMNPYLGYHAASWMNIFIKGDTGEYKDAIYGQGPTSLCTYDKMEACEVMDK